QALDDARSDRIANAGENDWNGRGGRPCRLGSQGSETRNNHIRAGSDKFGREIGQTLGLSFGGTEIESQVLAFCIAKLIEPRLDNRGILTREQGEISDPVELRGLLRARR